MNYPTAGTSYIKLLREVPEKIISGLSGWERWWSGIYTLKDAQNKNMAPSDKQMAILERNIKIDIDKLYNDPDFMMMGDKEATRKALNTLVGSITKCIKDQGWKGEWCKSHNIRSVLGAHKADSYMAWHVAIKDMHMKARRESPNPSAPDIGMYTPLHTPTAPMPKAFSGMDR